MFLFFNYLKKQQNFFDRAPFKVALFHLRNIAKVHEYLRVDNTKIRVCDLLVGQL